MMALRMKAGSMLAAACLGTAPALSQPSPPAAPPDMPKAQWIVNRDEGVCSLTRIGGDSPLVLRIDHNAAGNHVSISMGNKGWSREPSRGAKRLDVVLLPSGETLAGPGRSGRFEEGIRLVADGFDDGLLDRLGNARGIALQSDGTRLIEMAFPAARNAVAALRKCSADMAREWGVDLAAMAALKQRAVPLADPRTLFTAQDYPEDALRARRQGDVVARYDVTEDGEVRNCVAVNRVHASLARSACRVLERRLRYRPAIGADGRPAATQSAEVITFRLP